MEADWEIEIGGESPVIEAHWPGFVDLHLHPERSSQLPEAAGFPALAEALEVLNAANSPVWTSKCDVWPVVDADGMDADELDAPAGCDARAIGGYIDVLPTDERKWDSASIAAADCKGLCGRLREVPLRCCRVDLVVRQAMFDSTQMAAGSMRLGMTAYFTACGSTEAEAAGTFQGLLGAFARVLAARSTLE